ncbi:hypothetical protein FN846DRAFT_894405 [Sphaerosporella brunnea]|uniref:Uncharacterized protein n=1 Tax=Sphaerosporella brunnea TaxID=1250544 RepID=A0A5J5EJM2_9PEZI|nr:hypothetical protein FN846DRAFT_894405 [Sphaerosporella brunnea]
MYPDPPAQPHPSMYPPIILFPHPRPTHSPPHPKNSTSLAPTPMPNEHHPIPAPSLIAQPWPPCTPLREPATKKSLPTFKTAHAPPPTPVSGDRPTTGNPLYPSHQHYPLTTHPQTKQIPDPLIQTTKSTPTPLPLHPRPFCTGILPLYLPKPDTLPWTTTPKSDSRTISLALYPAQSENLCAPTHPATHRPDPPYSFAHTSEGW